MFWDTSALVPLLVTQPASEAIRGLPDEERAVWWGARTECTSAMCRIHREGFVTGAQLGLLLDDLEALLDQAIEVQPLEAVRERAERLLVLHPLRAADAFQLGAALVFCEEQPRGFAFVCLDIRLREAARAEGFELVPPVLP